MTHVPRAPIEYLDYQMDPAEVTRAILWFTPMLLDSAKVLSIAKPDPRVRVTRGNGSLGIDAEGDFVAIYGIDTFTTDGVEICAEKSTVQRAKASGVKLLTFSVDSNNQVGGVFTPFPTAHPCEHCYDSVDVMRNDVVSDDAVVITRKRGTPLHQVFSVPELELVHEDPVAYPDLAQNIVIDPDYLHLDLEAPEKLRLIADGEGAYQHRLSRAAEIRLAWSPPIAI